MGSEMCIRDSGDGDALPELPWATTSEAANAIHVGPSVAAEENELSDMEAVSGAASNEMVSNEMALNEMEMSSIEAALSADRLPSTPATWQSACAHACARSVPAVRGDWRPARRSLLQRNVICQEL